MTPRMRHLLRLARITRPERDPSARFPVHQVAYHGRTANAVAHFPYGMHANPGADVLALMVALSGNGEARLILPTSPESRPELAEGEVVWFHPGTGTSIHFREDGSLAIEAVGDVVVESQGRASVAAPEIRTASDSTRLSNSAETDDLHQILEEFLRFIDSDGHGSGSFQAAATAYADRVAALR